MGKNVVTRKGIRSGWTEEREYLCLSQDLASTIFCFSFSEKKDELAGPWLCFLL